MPSLLAKAAMMALGATGDRRLTGGLTGVSPCTHDSCGRRLVTHANVYGDPQLVPEASFQAAWDALDGTLDADDFPRDNANQVRLFTNGFYGWYDDNTANGNHGTITVGKNDANEDKVFVNIHITQDTNAYLHHGKNCAVHVTPSVKYGATDEGADLVATSVTFNDGNDAMSTFDHDSNAGTAEQPHAQWSARSTGCTDMRGYVSAIQNLQGGAGEPGGDGPPSGDIPSKPDGARRLEGEFGGDGNASPEGQIVLHTEADGENWDKDCTCHQWLIEFDDALTSSSYLYETLGEARAASATCVTTKPDPVPASDGPYSKFTVEMDKPEIGDNTLGFLGYELDIELQCSQNKFDSLGADQLYTVKAYAGRNAVEYPQHKKPRVQFTYNEDSSDTLKYSRHVSIDSSSDYNYAAAAHASLPASVTGSAWLQSSNVRFPAGQWSTFSGQAPVSGSQVTCNWFVDDSLLKTELDKTGSYASWVNVGRQSTGTPAFEYDSTGADVECASGPATIACGRKHTATIGYHTDLGIQAPLSKYFNGGDPKITCQNDDSIGSAQYSDTTAAVGKATLTIVTTHKLGTVVAGLDFGVGTPDDGDMENPDEETVDDQGEAFFLDADGNEVPDKVIFGADSLFTVGAANPDDFQDLMSDTYDYQFQVKYSKDGGSIFVDESQAGSTEQGSLAGLLGAGSCSISGEVGLACVQEILAGKLTTIEGSKVTRPTQYGEEFSDYKIVDGDSAQIKNDAGADVKSAITFRRNDYQISLNLLPNVEGDGKVKYDGSAADESGDGNIGFPGKSEDLLYAGDIILVDDTCIGCKDTFRPAKLGSFTEDGTTGIFPVFPTQAVVTNAALFDLDPHEDCGSSSPNKAICKSASDTNGAGTSFRCRDQSVSFTVDVRMDQLDNRVKDTQEVRQDYATTDPTVTDDDIGTPVSAAPAQSVYYVIAGATDVAATTDVELSFAFAPKVGDGVSLGTHTFSQTASPTITQIDYNAGDASQQQVEYAFGFKRVCESGTTDQIPHSRKYCSVYSVDHVTAAGFDIESDSQGHSSNKITEHKLQRFGENIEFSFSPGSKLPLEAGNTQVLVTSDSHQDDSATAYSKTLATYDSEELAREGKDTNDVVIGGCWKETAVGAGPKLHCAVLGFKATDFDSAGHLDGGDDPDACGDPLLSPLVPCPTLSFTVSQAFVVPDHELAAPAFAVAAGDQQDCGTTASVNRHDIGSGSVPVHVVGSDQAEDMYAQELELHSGWGGARKEVGSVDAENSDDAVGAHGEYQTTMKLSANANDNAVTAATYQASKFSEHSLQQQPITLTLHGKDVGTGNKASDVRYEVANADPCPTDGSACASNKYELLHCDGWTVGGCISNKNDASNPTLGDVKYNNLDDYKTGDSPTSRHIKFLLQKSDGGDPCLGKAKGAFAFGDAQSGGARIAITRYEDTLPSETHVYTLPIRCHTELAGTAITAVSSQESSSAWFTHEITLQLTGSAVDKSRHIDLLSTLDKDSSVAGFQNGDGETVVDSTITHDIGDDLTQVLTVVYDSDYQQSELGLAQYVRDNGANSVDALGVPAGSDLLLKVPLNVLGFAGVADGAVYPIDSMTRFGDIIQLNGAKMKGRVSSAIGSEVTIISSSGSGGERVQMYGGATKFTIPALGGVEEAGDLVFEILPDTNTGEITCNFVTVELESKTAVDADTLALSESAQFTFQLPCPRSKYDAARSDKVDLDYELTAISFGATQSYITLPATPDVVGLTSTAALGSCTADKELATHPDSCGLTVDSQNVFQNVFQNSDNSHMSATQVMSHFLTCGGDPITTEKSTSQAFPNKDMHVATVNVARAYTHTHTDVSGAASGLFSVAKFCEEVQVKYAAVKSADKSATITVASSQDMDFEVHVSALAYADCTATDGTDGVQLTATIDMSTKLATEAHTIDDLQTFYRDTDEHADELGKYELSYTNSNTAALAGPQDAGDHQLNIVGECQSLSSGTFDEDVVLNYRMVRVKNQVVYFAQASVELQISKPQDEQREEMDFDAEDLEITLKCAQSGAAFNGGCEKDGTASNPLPADFNARLEVSVNDGSAEADAFTHSCGKPLIRFGSTDNSVDTYDNALVETIGEAFKANTDQGKQELVGGENCEVTLGLANFGNKHLKIQWTITRNTPTQRLRRLLTYTFGSDGSSAVTSTSLTVAPAVRESEGAAVRSGDKIVEEITEKDADGVTTTKTRTTEVSDKTKISEWTGPTEAAVAIGSLALVGVAVILIKGCAASKDGIAAAGKVAVANGQLWNRNRFAP